MWSQRPIDLWALLEEGAKDGAKADHLQTRDRMPHVTQDNRMDKTCQPFIVAVNTNTLNFFICEQRNLCPDTVRGNKHIGVFLHVHHSFPRCRRRRRFCRVNRMGCGIGVISNLKSNPNASCAIGGG